MGEATTRLLAGALLVCSSYGCASDSEGDDSFTRCEEPRPEACTMEYLPVCGKRHDETWKTYSNACGACSDAAVVGHRPGACEGSE